MGRWVSIIYISMHYWFVRTVTSFLIESYMQICRESLKLHYLITLDCSFFFFFVVLGGGGRGEERFLPFDFFSPFRVWCTISRRIKVVRF